MKAARLSAVLALAIGLAGCGMFTVEPTYVPAANERVLLVIETLDKVTDHPEQRLITLHSIVPKPMSLNGGLVTKFIEQRLVDCAASKSATLEITIVRPDGTRESQKAEVLEWESYPEGSPDDKADKMACHPSKPSHFTVDRLAAHYHRELAARQR